MKPDLQEGARLLAEATERPWVQTREIIYHNQGQTKESVAFAKFEGRSIADAALIVYAVNNLEALLAMAREREELDDRRKAALTWLDSNTTQEALNVAQARRILREFAALHQQAKDEEMED